MRIVPRLSRFFYPEGDPGLPPPTPTPTPTPAPEPARPGRVTCEGCGCSLDSRGQIIARGEGLRAFMAREDEVTQLRKELDEKGQQVTELAARLRELEQPARKSVLW